jgi:hypothetical protein
MPISVNPGDNGSAVSTAAAATLNHTGGTITTESLATAAGADYTFTLTNSCICSDSVPIFTIGAGTNTTVPFFVHSVTVSGGSATIKIRNGHASAAFNGTMKIWFAMH